MVIEIDLGDDFLIDLHVREESISAWYKVEDEIMFTVGTELFTTKATKNMNKKFKDLKI